MIIKRNSNQLTGAMLTGCTYLNFGMFTRVPKDNSLNQFDAADLATCKVV